MTNDKSTVIFMGSPAFAVPTLEALITAPDFDVVRVVTQPDRPRGRGKKLSPTEVKATAITHDLPVMDMTKESYSEVAQELAGLAPDFIVVVAFGLILKEDLLDLPCHACVNLHASLLPKYRGVSPIHKVVLAGEAESGCSTMIMDVGIDTGEVLMQKTTPIEPSDTTGVLEARLATLGAPLLIDTLRGMRDGSVIGRKQDDSLATYTKKIRKRHGRINWERSAVSIERRIRAMQPWPTAFTALDGRRLIVLEALVGPDVGGEPGEVVSTAPLRVATGEGSLELARVKPEGKKEMPAQAFVAGYRVRVGARLVTPDL